MGPGERRKEPFVGSLTRVDDKLSKVSLVVAQRVCSQD